VPDDDSDILDPTPVRTLYGGPTEVEACTICDPDGRLWEDEREEVRVVFDRRRRTYVVAPARHTQQPTLDEIEEMLWVARQLEDDDECTVRTDAVDIYDHWHWRILRGNGGAA